MEHHIQYWRGEIYLADLDPIIGSEQGGTRPVLIIQNDVGNRFSPTVIVAAITSRPMKANIPTHVEIGKGSGLAARSWVLLEQIRTLDKSRINNYIGVLGENDLSGIEEALAVSLGMKNSVQKHNISSQNIGGRQRVDQH